MDSGRTPNVPGEWRSTAWTTSSRQRLAFGATQIARVGGNQSRRETRGGGGLLAASLGAHDFILTVLAAVAPDRSWGVPSGAHAGLWRGRARSGDAYALESTSRERPGLGVRRGHGAGDTAVRIDRDELVEVGQRPTVAEVDGTTRPLRTRSPRPAWNVGRVRPWLASPWSPVDRTGLALGLLGAAMSARAAQRSARSGDCDPAGSCPESGQRRRRCLSLPERGVWRAAGGPVPEWGVAHHRCGGGVPDGASYVLPARSVNWTRESCWSRVPTDRSADSGQARSFVSHRHFSDGSPPAT